MVKELKQHLRDTTRLARQCLSGEDRHIFNQEIANKLTALKEFKEAKTILFYASMPEEVATLEVIESYIEDKRIILPRTENQHLVLHHLKNIQHLQKGKHQILEPTLDLDVVDPSTVDLVIVPGLAFDEQKNRLGFGKGYYDRLLPMLNCPKVGLAYECQIVKDVPSEDHDHPLDMIVTEKRIIQ